MLVGGIESQRCVAVEYCTLSGSTFSCLIRQAPEYRAYKTVSAQTVADLFLQV